MLRIEVILGENDVMAISEGSKGHRHRRPDSVSKVRGRGKKPGPEIHASKGSEIFVPQFNNKYQNHEAIVSRYKRRRSDRTSSKKNGRVGKIFRFTDFTCSRYCNR